MGGVKRKDAPASTAKEIKKQKTEVDHGTKRSKASKLERAKEEEDEDIPFKNDNVEDEGVAEEHIVPRKASSTAANGGKQQFKLDTSSAEAHAKQRALAKERKASKPNADAIQRSKKLWEKLRRKSHVPPEERKQLVTELFSIIGGRVRDFVFKHDSVRVIQCALKYANKEQRKMIMQELQDDIRTLVESRYGKFLVAKLVVEGDQEIRNSVVPEFYGHVRRLVNHPEASWVVDDIYRQVATVQQKATMLREWYGAEFALFHRKPAAKGAATTPDDTSDLVKILEQSPERRKPILQYLLQMINSLVQKKLTGFTMLHDAMLQYFLAVPPGSEEHVEFLEILKGDIDAEAEGGGGDLFRNLAFTKSGSRLVCLALAYGSAKDRKIILRAFKDTVEMMAHDQHAKHVVVAGLDVPDDTKMSSKAIFFELLGQNIGDEVQRLDRLEQMVTNLNARLPILYTLVGMPKWLANEEDKAILEEIHQIKRATSKKAPEARRQGLLEHLSGPLLELVEKRAQSLSQSSFGCQFMSETLLEANGDKKTEAKAAVVELATGDPLADDHIAKSAAAGRMLKTLVLGGNFDPASKKVKLADPRLEFGAHFYHEIRDHVVDWACSDSSFVIVGLLESEDTSDAIKTEIASALKKGEKRIEAAATGDGKGAKTSHGDAKKTTKPQQDHGNAGAKMLLGKLK